MEKKKLDAFREVLNELRKKTADDYERGVESSGEEFSGSELPDPNDEASRTISRRILLQISDKNHNALTRINEALDRIEAGDYGECVECGKDIPEGRLELVPYAEYCVPCQERIEREGKEGG